MFAVGVAWNDWEERYIIVVLCSQFFNTRIQFILCETIILNIVSWNYAEIQFIRQRP